MPRVPLVEAVGERRRGRLVDDAQHLEAGDAAGIARRGALRVVEVGRHGDDRAIDFGVDLALLGEECSSARCFSSRRMNAEISGGVNSRSPRPIRTTPPASPPTRNGNSRASSLHVVDALAHEALHRIDGALRVGQQPPLRLAADVDRAVRRRPTRPTAPARRRSCRGSRPARRPSRRRRGCWWCRDRCRRLCSWLQASAQASGSTCSSCEPGARCHASARVRSPPADC